MARCIPEPRAAPGGSCRTLGFEYVLETHPKFLIKGVVSKRKLIMHACIINVLLLTTPLIRTWGAGRTLDRQLVLEVTLDSKYVLEPHRKFLIKGIVSKRTLIVNVLLLTAPTNVN